MKYLYLKIILTAISVSMGSNAFAQQSVFNQKYLNYNDVQKTIADFNKLNQAQVKVHSIAQSPGGKEIEVLEIGSNLNNVPAIFVAANLDGVNPLSTNGALHLAALLLNAGKTAAPVKWFVMPLGNPDANENFFSKVQFKSSLNLMKINEDTDELTNEDGFEDLNNDGMITSMRVKAEDGDFAVSKEDQRLLVKADADKGERGVYKIYTEGIDNDGDGLYNEDGEGGVNPGINFPHEFEHFRKDAGLWPGQSPETFGIMKFIFAHPEIAMTITLGESNLLTDIPQEGKSDFDPNRIKIPERLARMTNLPATQTYKMDELIKILEDRYPEMEPDESTIINFLGLGPEKSFQKNDLYIYEAFSKDYKSFLKDQQFAMNRIPAGKPRNGSFELWSYFVLGVPSVSLNLWAPENGKDSVSAFIPGNIKPQTGKEEKTNSKEKMLLDYLDKQSWPGFVDWKSINHPQLGQAEIGGFAPFAANTPPSQVIEPTLQKQIPFILTLASKLPAIQLKEPKVTKLGDDLYRLELFIENSGKLPYPIEMGKRNRQPAPLIIVLQGQNFELLEGQSRTTVKTIGSQQVKKYTWLIKTEKTKLQVKTECPAIHNSEIEIKIGG